MSASVDVEFAERCEVDGGAFAKEFDCSHWGIYCFEGCVCHINFEHLPLSPIIMLIKVLEFLVPRFSNSIPAILIKFDLAVICFILQLKLKWIFNNLLLTLQFRFHFFVLLLLTLLCHINCHFHNLLSRLSVAFWWHRGSSGFCL